MPLDDAGRSLYIHAVARGCHDFLRDEYNAEQKINPKMKPFDEMPFVLILRKPGKLQSADEILDSATLEDRKRVEREMTVPPVRVPENV